MLREVSVPLAESVLADLTENDEELKKQVKEAEIKQTETAELKELAKFDDCPPKLQSSSSPLYLLACELKNPTPTARAAAAEALGESRTSKAILPLKRALYDEYKKPDKERSPEVVSSALKALGKIGSSSTMPTPSNVMDDTRANKRVKASVTSGPTEHWFLSADTFVRAKTQFQTNDKGATIADKPALFYVALNFPLGDLASEKRSIWENVGLKILLQGSNKPIDSYGFGIELKGHYLKRLGI